MLKQAEKATTGRRLHYGQLKEIFNAVNNSVRVGRVNDAEAPTFSGKALARRIFLPWTGDVF